MKALSGTARRYILGVIAAGTAAGVWFVRAWSLAPDRRWLAVALAAAAAAGQVFKVEGATRKSSYNLSLVAYALALVLLGPSVAAAIVVTACVVEWVVHRYPWYIQSFNIGALLVALLAASTASVAIPAGIVSAEILATLRLVVLTVTFVSLNHLFVGIVIRLARGESLRESGVFDAMAMGMDASLVGLGALAGFIWAIDPWASLLVGPPLALLYFSLRVPMLQRQAVTDPKTGLYNARYFNDALKRELDRSERYDRPLTVVMADLDLLRNINNKYGHVAGDIVLQGIADMLRLSLRDYDVVSRFGGEEFAVLLGETTMRDAETKLERIRLAIECAEFKVPTSVEPIQVTMSFGLAERCGGQTVLDIIHQADLALYQAKREGRNRIRVSRKPAAAPVLRPVPASAADVASAASERSCVAADAMPATVAAAKTVLPEAPEVAAAAAAVAARAETAAAERQPGQPVWMNEALIVAVALAAAAMLLVSLGGHLPDPDWFAVAAFAAVVFGAELLSVEIEARDASVSTAVVPFVAAALLFGAAGVAVTSIAAGVAAFVKNRTQASRFVFNTSTHLIAGLVAIGSVRLFVPMAVPGVWTVVLSAAVAATAVYVVETGLLSLSIALATGERPEIAWLTRFGWLGPHYLALSLVAGASLVGYREAGVFGAVILMSPMLILRFGQQQYVEHTKEMVGRLRATNAELEHHTGKIERLNQELLLALTNMVELRDPYMLGHSQFVAEYAERIARRMGLADEVRDRVVKAGLLHDIGKLGIPEAVLQKDGLLDESEREVVQQHCHIGGDIVTKCSSLRSIVSAVRHHHERYDGRGYPDRLSGEQIPIEARILAVADSVEAMASDRPYRMGMDAEQILAEIRDGAGTQFDPHVARVFCELVEEQGREMIVNSALKVAQAAAEACDLSKLGGLGVEAAVAGVREAG
jgi:diguanylate cyclase (GGDEF)-like protein/putative nucleotidyltransferase with HDIG domain